MEEQNVQDIDIDLEMNKITLAAMQGGDTLKGSIVTLCGMYEVESTSPTPQEVALDMQRLTVDYMSGEMTDEVRDARLKSVLAKAMTAQDPLSTPQL